MERDLFTADSDSFFSIRGAFWEESRDRALADRKLRPEFGTQQRETREPEEDQRDERLSAASSR